MKQTLILGARHSAESCFHTSLGCHKKPVGDGAKLLIYLNSALKVLLGFDIFPRVPKKKSEILLPSVINCKVSFHDLGSAPNATTVPLLAVFQLS